MGETVYCLKHLPDDPPHVLQKIVANFSGRQSNSLFYNLPPAMALSDMLRSPSLF